MGRREVGQGQFIYSFDLDKVVPPDHLVLHIDAVLDLIWVHKELSPFYSPIRRPSIDPVLMIRMLILGMFLRSAAPREGSQIHGSR
jgi:transposase